MNNESDTPLTPVGDDALEARIVAWVLGEASSFEAAELEKLCAEDPGLRLFEQRMRILHGLIGEDVKAGPDVLWKLSGSKRSRITDLLGADSIQPVVSARTNRYFARRILLAAAACLMISVIAYSTRGTIWKTGGAKSAESRRVVDFMPASASSAPEGVEQQVERVESLRRAVQRQEDAVEDKRDLLSQIIRQEGIIYQGDQTIPGRSGGFDAADGAESDTKRLLALEQEKIQLESQIETLLKYDGEQLMNYAGGLSLPDNVIPELLPRFQEQQREFEALKNSGLSSKHPEVEARAKALAATEQDLVEATANLRETLKAKLELKKEQLAQLDPHLEAKKNNAIKQGVANPSFVDAKEDFEASRRRLDELQGRLTAEEVRMKGDETALALNDAPGEERTSKGRVPAKSPLTSKAGLGAESAFTVKPPAAAPSPQQQVPQLAEAESMQPGGSGGAGGGGALGQARTDDRGAKVEDLVTGGLRSGGEAITRNNLDAVLDNPNEPEVAQRSAGYAGMGTASRGSKADLSKSVAEAAGEPIAEEAELLKEQAPPAATAMPAEGGTLAGKDVQRFRSKAKSETTLGRDLYSDGSAGLQFNSQIQGESDKPDLNATDFFDLHKMGELADQQSARFDRDQLSFFLKPSGPDAPAAPMEPEAWARLARDKSQITPSRGTSFEMLPGAPPIEVQPADGAVDITLVPKDVQSPDSALSGKLHDEGREADAEGEKTDYYRSAYDHTRAELLAQVDKPWELSVPPVEAAGQKAEQAGEKQDSSGYSGLAQQEMIRRQNAVAQSDSLRDEGRKLQAEGDYAAAYAKQIEALKVLPEAEMVKDRRDHLSQLLGESAGLMAKNAQTEGKQAVAQEWAGKALQWNVQDEAVKAILNLQPSSELSATVQPFSTFSLHVSDASFKLAKAALDRGEQPDPASIRPEEFYNAFDYGDPAPGRGEPVACALEQCAHPAIPQRNLVRIGVRTGAAGRAQSTPLNLTLLFDSSGSMAREDRHAGMSKAVEQLAGLLKEGDTVSVIGFSRQPRLLVDRLSGARAQELNALIAQTPSEGGTNLEEGLKLAEELAKRQFNTAAQNRVVLFTDGAANLGDAQPETLQARVEAMRQGGIAFDAAGFGAEGLNDKLLERLTRNGNGRYYIVDRPEDADANFAKQLAGAFRPAAENVKVQVRFNPARVGKYKLIGFEEHRLKKEDFRNDAVDAAEMAAEEAGNALYQVEPLPGGEGEIGEVSVRFRDAASGQMVERTWTIPYEAQAPAFDQASPSIQLAGLSAFAAEKIRKVPMADAIDFQQLGPILGKVKARYPNSQSVSDLGTMIGKLK